MTNAVESCDVLLCVQQLSPGHLTLTPQASMRCACSTHNVYYVLYRRDTHTGEPAVQHQMCMRDSIDPTERLR